MADSDVALGRNPGRKANYQHVVNAAKGKWNGKVFIDDAAIEEPRSWKSPRLVFVNSMGDLFHEKIPVDVVQRVFAVMAECPQHTFQVLTKRPDVAKRLSAILPWPSNIWMGTSVEDVHVVQRIEELRGTDAKVKFLSLEPLLGEIPDLALSQIDWVIVGGESGPDARPMDAGWVRSVRNQCVRDNVPFFFKQWGGPNKKRNGRELDGRIWDEMPAALEPRKSGGTVSRDSTPTVWEADPHTLAKHAILREYLKAWMPILSRQLSGQKNGAEKVLFIDGFAGSGEYAGGEPGSPVIAIDTALANSHQFPVPICIVAIEKDSDRHSHLSGIIERRKATVTSKQVEIPVPICADCEAEINRFFVRCREKGRQFPPALVFLDQFGYSAVSMDLIRKVLEHRSCEVLSFMNWRDLNNYMTDTTKWPGITRAFGGDEWTQVIGQPQGARDKAFLATYKKALTERGGARYNCHFAMHDINDTLIYWLFFCTSSLRGLEEMKRAMWKVDDTGSFKFSDKHADQLFLLEGFTQDWLANALSQEFAGNEVTVATVREYVLVETPCYKYVDALRSLENAGRVTPVNPPDGHRKGTFKKYEDDDPSLTLAFTR